MSKWLLKQSTVNIRDLARQAGLHPVLARILAVRGLRSPAEVKAFLDQELAFAAPPELFAAMPEAVLITADALRQGHKCAIYGDYDADGVMSTVIMLYAMRAAGADVDYYIPSREGEGYGLNNEAIAALAADGVKLLLACDNGVSAFEQVAYANQLGLSVIILDHHELEREPGEPGPGAQVLPPAAAVVDAHRDDCPYPFKHYCAAGLCYRFAQALFNHLGRDWQQMSLALLPFAAIATVCDIVDLSGDNRVLVRHGLPAVSASGNAGLRALLQAVGLCDKPIDTFHAGFILGPCINASGRLDIARHAVELFLSEDAAQAAALAARLVELNAERRELTESGAALAYELILTQNLYQDKIIVLDDRQLPESVAGIIAGRIKEKFHRPVVIIAGGQDAARGSCRSIEAYDIHAGLTACRDLLIMFGGHPMAAGFSIRRENIPLLRERLNRDCNLSDDDIQPVYRIDCPLNPSQADLSLARQLELLAPFGKGNPQPLLAAKRLELCRLRALGREEQYLRWQICETQAGSYELIDFSCKQALEEYITATYGTGEWQALFSGQSRQKIYLDIIYTLSVNRFNGLEKAQLRLVDFRKSEA